MRTRIRCHRLENDTIVLSGPSDEDLYVMMRPIPNGADPQTVVSQLRAWADSIEEAERLMRNPEAANGPIARVAGATIGRIVRG